MDTNKILLEHGYKGRSDFTEIAKWAAGKKFQSEADMLSAIEEQFGHAQERIGLSEKPAHYELFSPWDVPTDSAAIDQLKMALRLPVAISGAGMPDLHPGYSLPIGGVVALRNAVAPSFVGYDIGCRMSLTIISDPTMTPSYLNLPSVRDDFLGAVMESTSFGLGARTNTSDDQIMDDPLWDDVSILKQNKQLAYEQLGSSGGGNHFCDVVVGEVIEDSQLGKKGERWIGLLTHSGSRGVGNKVGHYYAALADQETAKKYRIPKGYGWFDLKSELGQEYMAVMQLMGSYASKCHQIIHSKFCSYTDYDSAHYLENFHNFAWVDGDTVIHRKGATPAGLGQIGLIPGSSGTKSYIVEGLGNEKSLCSSSHGAGRLRSRSEEKKQISHQDVDDFMKSLGITYWGVAADETLHAYKPIESVMAAQADLVKPLAVMTPKVVVMGGMQSDDGD